MEEKIKEFFKLWCAVVSALLFIFAMICLPFMLFTYLNIIVASFILILYASFFFVGFIFIETERLEDGR